MSRKMRVPALLRTAALVAFVQFVGHGLLFVMAKPTHGPEEVAVVEEMQSHTFKFAAAPRSYWEMYFGYGLEAAFVCLFEGVLLLLLARLSRSVPEATRPFVALLIIANVAHLAMLARYFAFPLPMVFDATIVTLLIAAVFFGNPDLPV